MPLESSLQMESIRPMSQDSFSALMMLKPLHIPRHNDGMRISDGVDECKMLPQLRKRVEGS